MKSPFKFLDAYGFSDQKIFFGRKTEVDALYKMVFESPLILVYGFMGTGKTSVINCGLAGKFDGPDWYPFFIRRQNDFNDALDEVLLQASRSANGAEMSTVERVQFIYKTYLRPVYLIFDQFEELFILGDEEEQRKLISTIKTLAESSIACKVIIVMREEFLGNLYLFEKELPYIFDFKLRVEKMGNKKIKKVISNSFSEFNIQLEAPAEERLDQIIDKVSLGKSGIQLPYLQVYMDLFYKADYHRTYPGKERLEGEYPDLTFTKKEIDKFGTIDQVLEKFMLTQQVKVSKKLKKKYSHLGKGSIRTILSAFVSEEGTKIPVTYSGSGEDFHVDEEFRLDLPEMTNQETFDALKALEEGRLVRFTDDTIELAHDTLAAIIHGKRSHEELKLKEISTQLRGHYNTFLETGEHINNNNVVYYENFLHDLKLTQEIKDFIAESKAVEKKRRNKERKKLIKTIVFLLAFSIISLVSAGIAIKSKKDAERSQKNAELSEISKEEERLRFFSISGLYTRVSEAFQKTESDRTGAYIETRKVLKEAKDIDDDNKVAFHLQNDLFKKVTYFPFYKNKIPSQKNIVKTSAYSIGDSIHYVLSWSKDADYLIRQMLDQDYKLVNNDTIHIEGKIKDFVFFEEDQKLYIANNNFIEVWSLKDTMQSVNTIKVDSEIYCLEKGSKLRQPLFVGTERGLGRINVNRRGTGYFTPMQSFDHPISSITANVITNDIALSEENSGSVFLLNRNKFDDVLEKYPLKEISLEEGTVRALDFSKDGKLLAIAYDNGKAGIYKLSRDKIMNELIGHQSVINSITFSPDDQFVLTSSDDNKAIVWKKTGEPLKKLVGHKNAIFDASFFNDNFVLTAGEDDNMKVWNVESLAEESFTLGSQVTHISFSPDGETVIASCKDQMGSVNVIEFHEHGKEEFHAGHHNKSDSLFQPLKNPGDKPGFIKSLVYTPDTFIVMGSSSHLTTMMKYPDSRKQKPLDLRNDKKYPHHTTTRIRCVAVSNDLVAIGDGASGIVLRRRADGAFLPKSLKYRWFVNALVFSKDGKKLIAGYTDGLIQVWDVDSLNVVEKLQGGHTGRITSLAIEKDLLISGSYDNSAIVWEKDKDGEYIFKQQLKGHLSDVNAVDISMDSIDLVLTASSDNTVKIWKRNGKDSAWKEEPSFIRHLGGINTAVFDPKGEHVATGSNDKTVKIWNIHDPNTVLEHRIYSPEE